MRLEETVKESKAKNAIRRLEDSWKDYLNIKEASELTGLAVSTIWTMCKKNKVRTTNIYVKKTIFVDDLIFYFKKQIWNQ